MYSKDLSIIFPIYNEEKTIRETLILWVNIIKKLNISFEIILAEDGSTDNTKNILFKIIQDDKDNIFINNIKDQKRGYAHALLDSMKIANGKYIFCTDSDGQCSPEDFEKLWKKILLNKEDIIIGFRRPRNDSFYRIAMSKFFFILHRILFYSNIIDPSCPYVIFEKNVFIKLKSDLIFMVEGFWWGFIASAIKNNLKISQIKIQHNERTDGKTNVFLLNKIPSIALKNILGLFKIRLKN